MAGRRKKVVTTTEVDDTPIGKGISIPQGDQRGDDDTDIDDAIAALGGGSARAHLSRLDESRGTMVRLCTLDAHQVSQEFIQKNFGGGRYNIRFRRADGQIDKVRNLEIDRRIPAKLPQWLLESDMPDPTPAPARPAARPEDDEDMDFKHLYKLKMLDLIKRSDELNAQAAQRQMESATMQMSMMKTMMDSMSSFAKGMNGNGNGAPQITMVDLIKLQSDARKEIIELTDKLRGGSAEASSIDKALALISKLRAASDDMPETARESGGGMDGLLGELGKLVMPLLAAIAGRGAAPAQTTAPGASGAPSLPAGAPPAAEPPAAPDPMLPVLQIALQSLYEAAQRADDPKDKAISMMDLCPDAFMGKLREQVMAADIVDRMVTQIPEFAEYRNWLTEFVQAMRAEFANPSEEVPVPPADPSRN